MSEAADRRDLVVVGAGMGGLAAAAYAGRAGLSVEVLERSAALGGRAATRSRDGFLMNWGPHALYRAGEAASVLRELGVGFSAHAPPSEGLLSTENRFYKLPSDGLSLLATRALGWAAKAEAARMLVRLPNIDAKTLRNVTLSSWLETDVKHADVRALFGALFRVSTYANDPRRMSAGTALAQLQNALGGGVLYVDGGWQTLVDGIAGSARASGVVLEAGSAATELDRMADDSYLVTTADGRRIRAKSVVLAVKPRVAARLLASAGSSTPATWGRTQPVHAAVLDLALRRLPRASPCFVLGIDRPLYLSVHSRTARLAPEGAALIHVAKYLRSDETASEQDRAELEALMDRAQPGWRELVHTAEFLPRLTVVERLDLAEDDGELGRPAGSIADLPGVYLVGDWVRSGSWLLDASLASARAAAERVIRRSERRIAA